MNERQIDMLDMIRSKSQGAQFRLLKYLNEHITEGVKDSKYLVDGLSSAIKDFEDIEDLVGAIKVEGAREWALKRCE